MHKILKRVDKSQIEVDKTELRVDILDLWLAVVIKSREKRVLSQKFC